jgi:hypothetical protein
MQPRTDGCEEKPEPRSGRLTSSIHVRPAYTHKLSSLLLFPTVRITSFGSLPFPLHKLELSNL